VAATAVRLQMSTLRRLAAFRWGVIFALVGVAGIALRVWLYRSPLEVPNSDEAVVGLMARHFMHGEFATFFWGQSYGGSQEAMLTVPVFYVFGTGWVALRIVPIVLSAVAAIVLWRVGRRTIGEPAARIGAALFWIWPPFMIFQTTRQQDFYASELVYCGLLLLLGLRIVERPDRTRVGLFGLVLGLAFWQTSQIVPIAAAVIAWTVWKQPRCLRHLWVAAPLAVLGALPWLIWNFRHDWGSLTLPYGDKPYDHRLRVFFSPVLPMAVGLRAPFSQLRLLPGPLTYLVYAGLVLLFVYGAVRTRRRNVSLLFLTVAVFPWIYAISPQTLNSGEPRYVMILTPVLGLLFAQVATNYSRAVVVLALACVVSVVTLHRMETYYVDTTSKEFPLAPRDLRPLISTLDRLGLDHVYANYWLAYRLDFDTRERIIAVQSKFTHLTFAGGQAIPSHNPFVRYPPYEREVQAAHHGFVFFRQTIHTVPIVAQLERHGYRRYLVGPFVVYALGDAR
jgi:hypothetical protein